MDCSTCKERRTVEPVPYIVHESAMARNERSLKRLVVALIISIVVNLATVGAFLYVWQLYDYSSEETVYTYQQDGEGVNIIGDRNGVEYYGADSDGSEENPDSNP